jgi:hypothetical protein
MTEAILALNPWECPWFGVEPVNRRRGQAVSVRLSWCPLAGRSTGVVRARHHGGVAAQLLARRGKSGVLAYADKQGRGAFAFQPIDSHYLEVADDADTHALLQTVVEQLRAVGLMGQQIKALESPPCKALQIRRFIQRCRQASARPRRLLAISASTGAQSPGRV